MAKKRKETLELRVYEVPEGQLVLPLYGDAWVRTYGHEQRILHFHNLMEIGICRYGTGELGTIDGSFRYEEGTVAMFAENYPHITVSDGEDPNFWEYLFFDPKVIVNMLYDKSPIYANEVLKTLNTGKLIFDKGQYPGLVKVINEVLDEARNKERFHHLVMNQLMTILVLELMRAFGDQTPYYDEKPAQSANAVRISAAIEYIEKNLDKPIKVIDLADVCGMSEVHFRRTFSAYIDMSPMDYVNLMRIQKACNLLRKGDESMEFVAEECGFPSVSTFNRNFKKFLNTSPYKWKMDPENYEGRLNKYHIAPRQGW